MCVRARARSLRVQVYSKGSKPGFLTILAMTPELWTSSLTHRTQILYHVDISTVIMHLALRPGSRVVESGTGSGSLTTSLARAVAPHGAVFTFEFNADRVTKARKEFELLGIDKVVTVTHADACVDGFKDDELADSIDGVFLDLPQPWGALHHAHRVLRRNGIICCFSPCIEQVQRSCLKLAEMGFEDIRTVEALGRYYDVGMDALPSPPLGMLVEGVTAEALAPPAKSAPAPGAKRGRRAFDHAATPLAAATASTTNASSDSSSSSGGASAPAPASLECVPFPAWVQQPVAKNAKLFNLARGHTGYLTFASLYDKHRKGKPVTTPEFEEAGDEGEVEAEAEAEADAATAAAGAASASTPA
ncbi:methyltransferase domain-containing protein [archaeon]|nr:MAG: methyltransferase domain-containing protein [archaeon]